MLIIGVMIIFYDIFCESCFSQEIINAKIKHKVLIIYKDFW